MPDCLSVAHSRLADVSETSLLANGSGERVFPLKLEIPRVRTTILQKYLELRALEFHRRNSCGRRPGFRRRPRKPSTAKPGWRSISTLYLTAIFIKRDGHTVSLEKNTFVLLSDSLILASFPTNFTVNVDLAFFLSFIESYNGKRENGMKETGVKFAIHG